MWSAQIFSIIIDDSFGEVAAINACRAKIFFLLLGFSVMIPAFFSKCLRVYQIVRKSEEVSHVEVSQRGYWIPQFVFGGISLALLIAWNVTSPYGYKREYVGGSDPWNRSTESVGGCSDSNDNYVYFFYVVLLSFMSVSIYFGYKVRNFNDDYAEIKYINAAHLVIFQVFIVLFPIGKMGKETNLGSGVEALGFFLINSCLLWFIFGSKMWFLRREINAINNRSGEGGLGGMGAHNNTSVAVTQKLHENMASIKEKIFDRYVEKSTIPEEAPPEEKESRQKEADSLLHTLVDFQAEIDGVKVNLVALRDKLERRRSDILASAEKATSAEQEKLERDSYKYSRVIKKLQTELDYIEKEHYADE